MAIEGDVTFHPGWWSKHAGISFSRDFFSDIHYRIESDIVMRRLLYEKFGEFGLGENKPEARPLIGSDLIASGYLYSGILGCEIQFSDNAPPEVICANIKPDDIKPFSMDVLEESELWKDTVRQIEHLENQFGFVESHINLQGIQNIALDLRGSELFIDYYENPDFAKRLLELCTGLTIEIGKYLSSKSKFMSHGVTAITAKVMPDVYLTSNCTVEMISNEIYEEFLLEPDIRLSGIFTPFGIHHCGKTTEHVVDGYAKVKNLKFLEVGAGSDISAVRKTLPDVFLNLRYSPVRLKEVDEEAMRSEIEKMASEAGSRYSISCVGIDADTDDIKVKNFLKCVRDLNKNDK